MPENGEAVGEGGNGDKPDITSTSLTITYSTDGVIDLKGKIIDNEMLAIWVLEKAKDMIKAHNLKRAMAAQARIVRPGGIMRFARGRG